jgi:hypothetical protein
MKYLKSYENKSNPKIGDYVVCTDINTPLVEFIENNVGQFIKYNKDPMSKNDYPYTIRYFNIPEKIMKLQFDITNNERVMSRKEILFFSPNKKECETFIKSRKYNI